MLTRPARCTAAAVLTLLAASVLTSCGGSQDEASAGAADTFVEALAQQDGDTACSVLVPSTRTELEQSSGKPCAEAVLEEAVADAGGRVSVEAYGTMAQVGFERDTLFLTRFKTGWLVLAAACTPSDTRGRPYDCQVQGG